MQAVPVALGEQRQAGGFHGCGSESSCWRGLLQGVIGITLLYKCYFAE